MNPKELKHVMSEGLLSFPVTDFDAAGDFNATGYGKRLEPIEAAHQLYLQHGFGARDDAAMQYLIPNWKFNPKKPCLVR